MVLVYVIMEYTISYREIRYLVNIVGIQFACFTDQTPNNCLHAALNVYSSRLCFHPLNHNHDTKEALICYSVPIFLRARFKPIQFFNALQGRKHTISQPDPSMHASNALGH